MNQSTVIAMFERYMEAWQRGDVESCIRIYAPHARMDDPLLPEPLQGIEQLRDYFIRGFDERSPDTQREVLNVLADTDRIFFEWRINSSSGGSRGISVWDIEEGAVVWDRSYWFETA